MKIERPEHDAGYDAKCRAELEALASQPGSDVVRVCPMCLLSCRCSGSTTCVCGCSPACINAPYRLSSDPERHPIESGVMPLVYSLYELRLCRPCWSCEGHENDSGELNRVPRVWFYARAMLYPRLILEYLYDLLARKKLHYPWHIALIYFGEGLDTAFSLEPNLSLESGAKLRELREDMRVIAAGLREWVIKRAQQYLAEPVPM